MISVSQGMIMTLFQISNKKAFLRILDNSGGSAVTEQQKFYTAWQHLRCHKYTCTLFYENCFGLVLDIILHYLVTYLGKHNVKYKR